MKKTKLLKDIYEIGKLERKANWSIINEPVLPKFNNKLSAIPIPATKILFYLKIDFINPYGR